LTLISTPADTLSNLKRVLRVLFGGREWPLHIIFSYAALGNFLQG